MLSGGDTVADLLALSGQQFNYSGQLQNPANWLLSIFAFKPVTPVPDPSPLGLVCVGFSCLGGMLALRRRRSA
jgi:hypothetical protein